MWPFNRSTLTAKPYTSRFAAMGTVVWQQVYGIHALSAAETAVREIERLDRLWSPLGRGNILQKLRDNAGAAPQTTDDDTASILSTAKDIARLSHGRYDITAEPLTTLWRQAHRSMTPPCKERIDNARRLTAIGDLHLLPGNNVYLARAGQGIDLGGIGKGFAADRVRTIFQQAGICHALVNLGGNVMAQGAKPDGSAWKIGIKDPHNPNGPLIGCIDARDCSVVTSGGYERFFDYTDTSHHRHRYHHIIDPTTGYPAESDVAGVTVVSPSSTRCDALATAAFILGTRRGITLCESYEQTHVLCIDTHGKMHMSSGMAEIFTPAGE